MACVRKRKIDSRNRIVGLSILCIITRKGPSMLLLPLRQKIKLPCHISINSSVLQQARMSATTVTRRDIISKIVLAI